MKAMNENNKDTNQAEKERITVSPNISVNSDDLNELQKTISVSSENLETTKPTTKQQTEMKFRSADISHLDGKNLMVNIEGSQKRKIEEAKQKKKDKQEAEKRKKTEEHKRKHDARVVKRNKRINSLKTIAQRIWKLKFVFLGIIAVIVVFLLVTKIGIPTVEKIKDETKKATEEKIVAENKTTMIEIYQELAGKMVTKEGIDRVITSTNSDIIAKYNKNDGLIYHTDGSTESISFSISEDGTIINFNYLDYIGNERVSIFGGELGYYYSRGEVLQEYDNCYDAIKDYVIEKQREQG